MKLTLLILAMAGVVCVSLFAAENGENSPMTEGDKVNKITSFIPSSIEDFNGKTYSFDQIFLQGMLVISLAEYKKTPAGRPSMTAAEFLSEKSRLKADLAYGIMAAGQYASATKELSDFFEEARQVLGNEAVPIGVAQPLTALLGMASQSFQAKDGDIIDADGAGSFATNF